MAVMLQNVFDLIRLIETLQQRMCKEAMLECVASSAGYRHQAIEMQGRYQLVRLAFSFLSPPPFLAV